MNIIKLALTLNVLTLFSLGALAAGDSKSKFTFEPLYGVETSLVRFPEPARYVSQATYGARLLYGTTFLSAEAEGTQAKSRKDYASTSQKVEDTSDRLSLGIRSTLPIGKYIGIYARAGGRASQGKTIITTNDVPVTKDNPLTVNPYAGAGIQIALASLFAINAGVTLIQNSTGGYNHQYTLGLSGRFGNL